MSPARHAQPRPRRPDDYQGDLNSTMVRMAEVFRQASVVCAPNIVLVHNHRSGHPSPPSEDAALTRQRLRPAGSSASRCWTT